MHSMAGWETASRRTVSGNGYFAILRFYGPTEAALDKSWSGHDDGSEPDQLRQPRTALRYLYQSE
jgi:hypothetical protein